jgi:hypothetical protein
MSAATHDETAAIIGIGATQTELVQIFRMDHKKVRLQMANVVSSGRRNGTPVWPIREAAPFLLPKPDTPDEAELVGKILRMHHLDLPKMLSKEYWYGQNQRLNYLERIGDLWDTSAVVELAGDAFKTIRLELMLASDAVEREAGLTLTQRDVIDRLMMSALENMREKLVDGFKRTRESSRGKTLIQGGNGREEEAL